MSLKRSSASVGYKIKTSAYNAIVGEYILANTTSGAFTLTLPSSPNAGDTLIIYDAGNTFDLNNLTIGRNGSNINGAAEDLTANAKGARIELIYFNASLGWRVF